MLKKEEFEVQKQLVGKDLWNEELVEGIDLDKLARATSTCEKIIVYGESNVGKTRWYLKIPEYLAKTGTKPEQFLMTIIFPDRITGIVKLLGVVPKEYRERILVFPVSTYEELVSATATAYNKLMGHYEKTGVHGWMVIELLNEAWIMAQDYYSRQAYGVTLADYFALKRADVKAKQEETTAYSAFEGWGDWVVVKYFHNYNWVDKIKRFPFHVIFTAEVKEETKSDSIFAAVGYRPAGEKDNIHRVDTVIYLANDGKKYIQRCLKLTGYKKVYSEVDITDKNGYEEHQKILKKLEQLGYKETAMKEVERVAGIVEEAGVQPSEKPSEKIEKSEKVEERKEKSTEEVVL